jgi:2,4-dienoyl-CoA reductase-like NADH-dependent reductase (Old Yellow Enzyme family)
MWAMHRSLEPGRIGGLKLRNRIIKTATYEGLSPGGRVTDGLVCHHADMARQGVGLTTVAYGAVSPEGRTFADQLLVTADSGLEAIAQGVHRAGGAVSLQLAHCGGFSKNAAAGTPMGPSAAWNPYGLAHGLPRVRAMGDLDIQHVIESYAQSAAVAQSAGFDAVEVHCGHGYLISQFLSPIFNKRTDGYGGDLAGRMRLATEVVAAVRRQVGPDFPVLAKTNLSDGVRGGSNESDAVHISMALEAAGVDAIVPSGGLVQRSAFYLMRGDAPVAEMAANESSLLQRVAMRAFGPWLVRAYPYTSSFFFEQATTVVKAVEIPVVLLGGVDSGAAIERAFDAGFSFVAMGRALLADPDFVERMAAGESVVSRCTHCNLCVARMNKGVRCALPD